MTERTSALLTDLYQINMMQAYLDRGATDTAVFELFARNLPPGAASWSPPGWSRRCNSLKPCSYPRPRSNGSRAPAVSGRT